MTNYNVNTQPVHYNNNQGSVPSNLPNSRQIPVAPPPRQLQPHLQPATLQQQGLISLQDHHHHMKVMNDAQQYTIKKLETNLRKMENLHEESKAALESTTAELYYARRHIDSIKSELMLKTEEAKRLANEISAIYSTRENQNHHPIQKRQTQDNNPNYTWKQVVRKKRQFNGSTVNTHSLSAAPVHDNLHHMNRFQPLADKQQENVDSPATETVISNNEEIPDTDLFTAPPNYAKAHLVDTKLRMSKGIAYQFKRRYSGYDTLKKKAWQVGDVAVLEPNNGEGPILNVVTKERHFHKYIRNSKSANTFKSNFIKGLEGLRNECTNRNITKLAIPPIGSGLDRLPWAFVRYQISKVFKGTDIHIQVYFRTQMGERTNRSNLPPRQAFSNHAVAVPRQASPEPRQHSSVPHQATTRPQPSPRYKQPASAPPPRTPLPQMTTTTIRQPVPQQASTVPQPVPVPHQAENMPQRPIPVLPQAITVSSQSTTPSIQTSSIPKQDTSVPKVRQMTDPVSEQAGTLNVMSVAAPLPPPLPIPPLPETTSHVPPTVSTEAPADELTDTVMKTCNCSHCDKNSRYSSTSSIETSTSSMISPSDPVLSAVQTGDTLEISQEVPPYTTGKGDAHQVAFQFL